MYKIDGNLIKTSTLSGLWTFPTIIVSSLLIAWAAESAQFFISQGLSLAILAWIQTLPEFAVEAVIAYEAPKIPHGIALISANLTGSLRLLVGLGWPLIYFTASIFHRRKYKRPLRVIHLEDEHSVEVMALLPPIFYFVIIWAKGTLNIFDGIILFIIYFAYLFVLRKIPPKETENSDDEEWPVRHIIKMKPILRNLCISSMFIAGAVAIYFTAKPFLHSMLSIAVSIGVSEYVFVQWVAPFLSEFPEKLSAVYWARKITGAPMALMNMVSSNINQWTMLAGIIPFVYSYSLGHFSSVVFDDSQKLEIILTIAQSALGFLLLCNMSFSWYEASVLFALWVIQFFIPAIRLETSILYCAWIVYELTAFLLKPKKAKAFYLFISLFKSRILKSHS